MRYLIVENGIVTNAVEAESADVLERIFPHASIVQHNHAGPGWIVQGKGIIPPSDEKAPESLLWEEIPIVDFLAKFTPKEWRGFKNAAESDDEVDHLLLILSRANTVHRLHPLVRRGLSRGVELGILSAEREREIGG